MKGRVVLITGAARQQGIGFHLALEFIRAECSVVLWDSNSSQLKSATSRLVQMIPPN